MNTAYLESKAAALPETIRKPMVEIVRELDKMAFGVPDAAEAVAAQNLDGHLVPFTTSSVADREVPVAHNLARTPRLIIPVIDPNLVGCRLVGDLEITRVADSTYLYVSSGETSLVGCVYVE